MSHPATYDFQPFSKDYLADAYKTFGQIRDQGRVSYVPDLDLYLVSHFDDVSEVLKNRDVFLSENATSPFMPVCPEAQAILSEGFGRKPTLSNCDPPRHTQMRHAVARNLTPRRWAKSQPLVRAYAEELVEALVAKPVADLVGDFASPLPVYAGFALIGFPTEDAATIKDWCGPRVMLTYGRLPPAEQVKAAENVARFWTYTKAHVERKIADPDDDLTSDLLAMAKEGDITVEDVVNIIYSVALASHETSQNAMINGLHALLKHREAWDAVCNDHALIPNAIDELLRFNSPTIALRRTAGSDTEIGGASIPKGAKVMLLTGAANHDPDHFPDPTRLDLARSNAREHLAFGKQWHFCMGAPLARFEFSVALELLTTKAPRMRMVENQPETYAPIITIRALERLLVEPSPQA